jgi:glycosyltransferase involved in cell wall biosynthesis
MTKDTILFMCSPDIRRLNARRAIASVKATDLSRAELYVIDNGFDPRFNHSVVMNDMLRHAERTGRNVVILDDDVEIHRYDWLDRLYSAADDLGADIVGCVHTDARGTVNHMGIVPDEDGLADGGGLSGCRHPGLA